VRDTPSLVTGGGRALHGNRWSTLHPRMRLLVLHGFAEHAERYGEAAQQWNKQGIETWCFDQIAHGRTAGTGGLGRAPSPRVWRTLVRDCLTVAHYVDAQDPPLPMAVLGHSMGSVVLQRAMLDGAWAAPVVVLTGTVAPGLPSATWRQVRAEFERIAAGPESTSERQALLGRMFKPYYDAFPNDPHPLCWVTSDVGERARMNSDPLCSVFPDAMFWGDLLAGYQKLARLQSRAARTSVRAALIASGADDPVHAGGAGLAEVAARLRRIGVRQVTIETVPHVRHGLLHDVNAGAVVERIGEWLLAQDYAKRSSARMNSSR
jgi:alpha-beta hydrolase superfamily lysophospholipase